MRCLLLPFLCGVFTVAVLRADEKKPIMLFDGKSLEEWQVHDAGGSGTVELQDGQMILGLGESLTGVIYKKTDRLPLTNYEITLEAQRLDGTDFFCGLTFPVGGLKTCATLVLGGWGGSVTGISSLDGLDASDNSTGHYRKFANNTWYRIKIQVTPDTIKVWSNEEEIINVDIAGKKVGLRPGPIEDFAPFSLTSYQTKAAIRDVKITPISSTTEKTK